ncbi:sensor histidine kinase [Paenibacillus sedimenti]|uniref:Heme sensor protein HssS n=1 Tax=Paenibacillus sedimenti TaxID=2770274 RepID=A0A926KPF0_9BACL|nr:HAMP domain-containing sensor histidine kinase [Paenibacillus sedimenti]MBD0381067.1 HAMP domain-containing histidine kinase [Paenibacillus sedimenti]
MIKTLYLRVVLTFSAVVVTSVLLAFPIAMFLYTDVITTEVETGLLKVGNQLVKMSKEFEPKDLESFLEESTNLTDSYALTLFDSDGNPTAFGMQNNHFMHVKPEEVKMVLEGQTLKKMNLDYGKFQDPAKVNVGLHLQVDGKQYALFVAPKFSEETRNQIRTSLVTVLIIVLLIGSFLILIASRYIVSPIKKLTLATNRLARGNFNVYVKVKRKDEIGLLAEGFNHMAGELKQLEQMRQDFVSNVSHEIQSPLTSIRGFSKALRQPDIQEEDRHRYLEIIERESERLSRLSENLLKLASLESEHHPFLPTTFDLDEQLRRVVVFYEPQWSDKQLELDLDLPKVKITADADQLNQVWMNLLGNAIKFTPPHGKIRIKLEVQTDRVHVLIQDNGIGIRKEDQDRIFDRFYKADQSRQRENGGNGLGLSIARKIIEVHKGMIEVRSEPGEGTLFVITLPTVAYPPKQHN